MITIAQAFPEVELRDRRRVQLRQGSPADAEALTRIAFAAKRHWNYPETWIEQWRDDLTVSGDYLREHWTVVAEWEGEILGWCGFSGHDNMREIDHLWVDPPSIGLGVGDALLRHGIRVLRNEGADTLRILADPNAAGFYRRFGARQVRETPSKPPGRVLPVMILNLGLAKV